MASPLFNTPGSVKSLRAYWKTRTLPDPSIISQELMGESDRASVILAASLLDDALVYKLTQYLVIPTTPEQQDDTFRYDGPLGSFSSRVEIAVTFSFIDDTTRSQLNDIREMRNACAHSTKPMSFAVPQLLAVAKRLFYPNGVFRLQDASLKEIKLTFVYEFLMIHNTLIHGSREAGLQVMRDSFKEVFAERFP